MAVDYVIDYGCTPKQHLTTPGILGRLKGRDQAERIIKLYRDAGDNRRVDKMGFEFTRNTPDGTEENQTILVKDLLRAAADLDDLGHHCQKCPANITGEPFGCFGRVRYPISDHAERWLLLQLPQPHEAPLIWTLLGENLREINQHSADVQQIRETGNYFESGKTPRRRLGEIAVSGDNVFYLLFMGGHISPARAVVLMLFFGAIPRNLEAPELYKLTPPTADAATRYPFQFSPDADLDDTSIRELKRYFRALHRAWQHNVPLLIDA